MILIDYRKGSVEFEKSLSKTGVPTLICTLDFADFAFTGRGEGGKEVSVGIERKAITDMISSIRSGRLTGHQLPGLVDPVNGYDYRYLVVEGDWRTNREGLVTLQGRGGKWEPAHGRMTGLELEKQLLTLETCGGIYVRHTTRSADTVRYLHSLYRWWTDSDLDGHSSHLSPKKVASIFKDTQFRQTVRTFPDAGMKVAIAAEKLFGSVYRAVNAKETEWAELKTKDKRGKERRLGFSAAERIYKALRRDYR